MAQKSATFASSKRALIDKANTRIFVATAVAAFTLMFTLVAGNTLVRQALYQNRVIDAKKDALKTAQESLDAVGDLATAYRVFTSTPQNVLGGNPAGNGDKDGDNAKIILDALPSKYDFPALTTSVEKLVTNQGLTITSITGNDDEVAQKANQESPTPQPIEMPIDVAVEGGYPAIQALVGDFERSIRPFQIQALEISATTQGAINAKVSALTYFQPEKSLNVKKEVVK